MKTFCCEDTIATVSVTNYRSSLFVDKRIFHMIEAVQVTSRNFFSRKTNVNICTCCQVNENCLRSINMTYPLLHQRFRFQRGLHNPHQSLSFSSKAEYYRSINILLYYVCFCYLSVPMNNTQLYWTCANLIPTGL